MKESIFGIPFDSLKDPRITAEHRPLDDINTVDSLHTHADSYLTQPVADTVKVSAIVDDFLRVVGVNPALQETIPLFYELIYSFSQCEGYFSALISKQLAPLSHIAVEAQTMNLLSHISHLVAIMDEIGTRAITAKVPSILTFPEINQCLKLLLSYKSVITDFSAHLNTTNRESLDEVLTEIDEIDRVYRVSEVIYLNHAIDILKKYDLLPTAFQYTHKAKLNQDDFFELSASTLPYFILDNFVREIRAGRVNDQDIFTMSHSLFQIKTRGTSDPEHACQHYALLILIAQQTRHLQQTHVMTDGGSAVPTSSSSAMTYAAPSAPATPTRASIEYPQDLCIELIALWQSNKADARMSELRILFANYQSQLKLSPQHVVTYLGQFHALCYEYFLRTAGKRLKLDPHTVPATQLQALMLMQTQERITARVGKSNTYQFVKHLNELCQVPSTVALSAVDLTDEEKLVQCISTGAYQWEKSEFNFTFVDYVEQVENILADFALYLILRDYLVSKRREDVELNQFNKNINILKEKLDNITDVPGFKFTINGKVIVLEPSRIFVDALLRTFITTMITKKSTSLSINLIGSLFQCMLIIDNIDKQCTVRPLEWAYTLLFLLKAMTRNTDELYSDELKAMSFSLINALNQQPMIEESTLSSILVSMLPLIYNEPGFAANELYTTNIPKKGEEVKFCATITAPTMIDALPHNIREYFSEPVKDAVNKIVEPMIGYTMDVLDGMKALHPSDYEYQSVIFYTLLVSLIKCRQAINGNQLFHIDTELMNAPRLLQTLHQQFQPSRDTSVSAYVSIDDMSATSDSSSSSPRSLSSSPILALATPTDEIAPVNSTTDWLHVQLHVCLNYLEQFSEDMAARVQEARGLKKQKVTRLSEEHVLLLRKQRASRLSRQEANRLHELRATGLDEQKAMRLGELEDDISGISPLRYIYRIVSPLIATIQRYTDTDGKQHNAETYANLFTLTKGIVCTLLEAAAANADIFDENDHPLEYALLLLLLLKNIVHERRIRDTIIDENLARLLTRAFESCSGTQVTNNRRYTEIKLLFALHYVQLEFAIDQITEGSVGQHELNEALRGVLKLATLRRVKLDDADLRDRLKNHIDNLVYVDKRTYAQMNEIITKLSIKNDVQFKNETPSLECAFIYFPGARDSVNLLYYKIQGDIKPISETLTISELGLSVNNHAELTQSWLNERSVSILTAITRKSEYAIVVSTQQLEAALTLKRAHLSTSIFTALMKLRTAQAALHKTDIEPHIWNLLTQAIIHLAPIKPTALVTSTLKTKPQNSPSSSRSSIASTQSAPNVSRMFANSSRGSLPISRSRGSLPTSASSSHIAAPSAMWSVPAPTKTDIYIKVFNLLKTNDNNLHALLTKDAATGLSPIQLVAREFCGDTLALIAERCKKKDIDVATLLNTVDENGNTALHDAITEIRSGAWAMAKIDAKGEAVALAIQRGEISVDEAAKAKNDASDSIASLTTQCAFLEFMIQLGANPNQPNKTGETALEQAARINDARRDRLLPIFGATLVPSAPSTSAPTAPTPAPKDDKNDPRPEFSCRIS